MAIAEWNYEGNTYDLLWGTFLGRQALKATIEAKSYYAMLILNLEKKNRFLLVYQNL